MAGGKVYVAGQEPAKGGQDLDKVAVNGKELASNANASLAVTEVSGKERSIPGVV